MNKQFPPFGLLPDSDALRIAEGLDVLEMIRDVLGSYDGGSVPARIANGIYVSLEELQQRFSAILEHYSVATPERLQNALRLTTGGAKR